MLTTDLPRLQPQDLDAERAVLGAALADSCALACAQEVIRPEDFYDSRHQRIFRAMSALLSKNHPIDLITLGDSLEQTGELSKLGGRAMLAELAVVVASASNIRHYSEIVRETAQLRAMIRYGSDLQERAYRRESINVVLDEAERRLCEIATARDSHGPHTLAEVVSKTMEVVDQAFKHQDTAIGIPTGFAVLDQILGGGLQPSDLDIIGARPGMGKTSLALGIARHAAERGFRVGVISLEMSDIQLGLRLCGMEASIDLQALRMGRLTPTEWTRLAAASEHLESLPLWIDDSSSFTVEQVIARARHEKTRHGLDLLVVDYLQLLQMPDAETRQQGVAEASRRLKLLAKELGLSILALSQLSRDPQKRTDNRPVLSDLRDSGAIEQDADVVIFLYREAVNNPETEDKDEAEVLIRKHRNGPIGERLLRFVERYARFEDLKGS
jgi:replicative DNA helicase